jgi:hypothetical protein
MNFVVNNQEDFRTNLAVYSINKQDNKYHLYRPLANILCFQNSTYYAGINFQDFTISHTSYKKAQLKVALRMYLNTLPFYALDEYLMFKKGS